MPGCWHFYVKMSLYNRRSVQFDIHCYTPIIYEKSILKHDLPPAQLAFGVSDRFTLHAHLVRFSIPSNLFLMTRICLSLLHQVASRNSTWDLFGNRNGIEDALALQENSIHFLQMPAVCFGEEKVDD